MSISYKVAYRTTEDLRSPSYMDLEDPYGILALTELKRRAFVNNPFLCYWNKYSQQVGYADGKAFACEFQFPVLLKTPLDMRFILAGSTTFVAKEYRKCGVGLHFGTNRDAQAPDVGSSGSSMSQMMVKMLKLLKANIFELPRYIMLFKSRAVVEMFLKTPLNHGVSAVADCVLCVFYRFVSGMERIENRHYQFKDVSVEDVEGIKEIASIISRDPHAFAEVHDERWLKWMMTESFEGQPMSTTAVIRGGKTVGFYMTKKRFYEKASHRGFRNVWLGSIMEWQVVSAEERHLPWLLLHAALQFRGQVDAVEVVTNDCHIAKLFKFFLARHIGDGNYTYNPAGRDPLWKHPGLCDENCWRLRPAMCDAGLV